VARPMVRIQGPEEKVPSRSHAPGFAKAMSIAPFRGSARLLLRLVNVTKRPRNEEARPKRYPSVPGAALVKNTAYDPNIAPGKRGLLTKHSLVAGVGSRPGAYC